MSMADASKRFPAPMPSQRTGSTITIAVPNFVVPKIKYGEQKLCRVNGTGVPKNIDPT